MRKCVRGCLIRCVCESQDKRCGACVCVNQTFPCPYVFSVLSFSKTKSVFDETTFECHPIESLSECERERGRENREGDTEIKRGREKESKIEREREMGTEGQSQNKHLLGLVVIFIPVEKMSGSLVADNLLTRTNLCV